MTDTLRDQIAAVLIEHTRRSIEGCHCGWGADFTKLGQSHPHHVAEQLQPIIDEAAERAQAIGDIVRPVADLWSTTDQHHWDGCHRNHPGCLAETILARLDGDQGGTP